MHLEDNLCTNDSEIILPLGFELEFDLGYVQQSSPKHTNNQIGFTAWLYFFRWLLHNLTEQHIVSKHLLTLVHRLFNY